jgi:hypothetical protein
MLSVEPAHQRVHGLTMETKGTDEVILFESRFGLRSQRLYVIEGRRSVRGIQPLDDVALGLHQLVD